jgi:hypothetical protein
LDSSEKLNISVSDILKEQNADIRGEIVGNIYADICIIITVWDSIYPFYYRHIPVYCLLVYYNATVFIVGHD